MDVRIQALYSFIFFIFFDFCIFGVVLYKKYYGNDLQKAELKRTFWAIFSIWLMSFLFILFMTINIYRWDF